MQPKGMVAPVLSVRKPSQQQEKNVFATRMDVGEIARDGVFGTAGTKTFPVDPKTTKMQLTEVFMRRKAWVDAQTSFPGSIWRVINVKTVNFSKVRRNLIKS